MKYLLLVVIALAAVVAADEDWKPTLDKEAFERIHNECNKESGVTVEQIEKIRNLQHPDEKPVHDYLHCTVKKLGVFTDDKGYSLDRLMTQFSALIADVEEIRDIVTKCVEASALESTPAERAFRGHSCLLDGKLGDAWKKNKKEVA